MCQVLWVLHRRVGTHQQNYWLQLYSGSSSRQKSKFRWRKLNLARIRNENLLTKNKNSLFQVWSQKRADGRLEWWDSRNISFNKRRSEDIFIYFASGMVGVLMKHVSKFSNHANSFKWILPTKILFSPSIRFRIWRHVSTSIRKLISLLPRWRSITQGEYLLPEPANFLSYHSSLIFVNPQGERHRFLKAFHEPGDLNSLQGIFRQKSRYLTFRNLNDGIPSFAGPRDAGDKALLVS